MWEDINERHKKSTGVHLLNSTLGYHQITELRNFQLYRQFCRSIHDYCTHM